MTSSSCRFMFHLWDWIFFWKHLGVELIKAVPGRTAIASILLSHLSLLKYTDQEAYRITEWCRNTVFQQSPMYWFLFNLIAENIFIVFAQSKAIMSFGYQTGRVVRTFGCHQCQAERYTREISLAIQLALISCICVFNLFILT